MNDTSDISRRRARRLLVALTLLGSTACVGQVDDPGGPGLETRILPGGGHRLRLDDRAVAEAEHWLSAHFAESA